VIRVPREGEETRHYAENDDAGNPAGETIRTVIVQQQVFTAEGVARYMGKKNTPRSRSRLLVFVGARL
jgi:hypothetical protein